MSEIVQIPNGDVAQWIIPEEIPHHAKVAGRCTEATVKEAVAHLGNVDVVSVQVNRTGSFNSPQGWIPRLPDFCDVRLHVHTPGGHIAHVVVWAPLQWNGRFLGTTGGGNRTAPQWIQGEFMRSPTLSDAIRNGFATASTDAGVRDDRPFAWGLDEATGDIDWELTENWLHRSTHDMTLVAKAVVKALYGTDPAYSYLVGTSGGGRQTLVQAQRYPEDYDGFWASCPAINWSALHVAQMWPPLVMKELNNPVPPEKLEAFREAAIAAFDGDDGLIDGIISSTDFKQWDPSGIIGQETPAGTITALDAQVMQKIWDGPCADDGSRLWFGLPIQSESWGLNHVKMGVACTTLLNGKLVPAPFALSADWMGSWLQRDANWDWTTLTFEKYEVLFKRSITEFSSLDSADPDLTGLKEANAKLLLSHGMADEVIPPQGTLDYFQRILQVMGGEEATNGFLRFFLSPGDVHSNITGRGPGLTLSTGMAALMEWVEDGHAPEVILGSRMDVATGAVTMTRPICRYPNVARYNGGDPAEATSFNSEALS